MMDELDRALAALAEAKVAVFCARQRVEAIQAAAAAAMIDPGAAPTNGDAFSVWWRARQQAKEPVSASNPKKFSKPLSAEHKAKISASLKAKAAARKHQ
jgi:hypothetical protein